MCANETNAGTQPKKRVTALIFGMAVAFLMLLRSCEETEAEPPLPQNIFPSLLAE